MPKAQQPTRGEVLFTLGKQLAVLVYRIELAWCDVDDPEDRTSVERVGAGIAQVADTCRLLREQLTAAEFRRLELFRSAIIGFWDAFPRVWQEDGYRNQAIRRGGFDPELVFENNEILIENSPLRKDAWSRIEELLASAQAALTVADRALIELGQMLDEEVCPTIFGGQLSRGDNGLAYFAGEFTGMVNQAISTAAAEYPALEEIHADFSSGTESSIRLQVQEFGNRIAELLHDPPLIPGYLGTSLDYVRQAVVRGGRDIVVSGPIGWNLMRRLFASGESHCSRATLEGAWIDGPPLRSAFDQALRALRGRIEPLGITICSDRNLGWKLQVIEEA